MSDTKNLWPEFGDLGKIRSPKTILAEQAVFLSEKTSNVINAKVETLTAKTGDFYQRFMLYVPALNNYTYELFVARHKVTLYPCSITLDDAEYTAEDESEFIKDLQEIFSSSSVQNVIKSLYSQAIE